MKEAAKRFLKTKNQSLQSLGPFMTAEDIYSNIDNKYVSRIFTVLHHEFNRLYKYMYSKSNLHFNAEESRQLLEYIELYDEFKYWMTDTEYAFVTENEYNDLIQLSKGFLQPSGGSAIPIDLQKISIVEYDPIFFILDTIKIPGKAEVQRYKKKLIGQGSYANICSYKDSFYDKKYVVKKALVTLDEKEIERFELEYQTMKKLNSPYILEVYNYNPYNNEYIAEYADETIFDYIKKNNNKIDKKKRYNLILQILNGFEYIHSKGYMHRDISYTNVLVKHYDDTSIIKISDFGLVKEKNSNLTSIDTENKGSLNDQQLSNIGFKHYKMEHEVYALTRLLFYILTGRTNMKNDCDKNIKEFLLKGTNPENEKRYKNIQEIRCAIKAIFNNQIL